MPITYLMQRRHSVDINSLDSVVRWVLTHWITILKYKLIGLIWTNSHLAILEYDEPIFHKIGSFFHSSTEVSTPKYVNDGGYIILVWNSTRRTKKRMILIRIKTIHS